MWKVAVVNFHVAVLYGKGLKKAAVNFYICVFAFYYYVMGL